MGHQKWNYLQIYLPTPVLSTLRSCSMARIAQCVLVLIIGMSLLHMNNGCASLRVGCVQPCRDDLHIPLFLRLKKSLPQLCGLWPPCDNVHATAWCFKNVSLTVVWNPCDDVHISITCFKKFPFRLYATLLWYVDPPLFYFMHQSSPNHDHLNRRYCTRKIQAS